LANHHTMKMAFIPTRRDLRHALLTQGVGRPDDWKCIRSVVKSCQEKLFSGLENFLNEHLMKKIFDVSRIRDDMKNDLIFNVIRGRTNGDPFR